MSLEYHLQEKAKEKDTTSQHKDKHSAPGQYKRGVQH